MYHHVGIYPGGAERIKRKEEELQSNSRILGGVPATVGQYPFKTGLIGDVTGLNTLSVCGGALISKTRVATAAHCWNDAVHQICGGSPLFWDLNYLFSGGTRITASAAAVHPNWNPILVRNDIAVLYLLTLLRYLCPLERNFSKISQASQLLHLVMELPEMIGLSSFIADIGCQAGLRSSLA
ncbi:hypothetical protein K1T71_008247 [Dendrolimus kikuchii]|uniref:Uncharacterized protein n=1 Tax=Dendrolimus kikuchii TaxID=765133 RepID=A0ACC1CWN8_9NEOP|nr:hypothetical protein K1T71_008247 [Dendrolimus kikuchii]